MDEFIYNETVHKDFQVNMNQLIKFIRESYGDKVLEKYFLDIGAYVYKPLIDRIKKNGLIEMKKHLDRVFKSEGGKYKLSYKDSKIIFEVLKCPAIHHMKKRKTDIDKSFCEASTKLINQAIAKECGYNFSVDYNQEEGKCIQKFWKE